MAAVQGSAGRRRAARPPLRDRHAAARAARRLRRRGALRRLRRLRRNRRARARPRRSLPRRAAGELPPARPADDGRARADLLLRRRRDQLRRGGDAARRARDRGLVRELLRGRGDEAARSSRRRRPGGVPPLQHGRGGRQAARRAGVVVRLLVLSGTKFLGRATVESALEAGHDVTLFNRGETNPELFPEAEQIRGDRTEGLAELQGREWDAVLDPSGQIPAVVRASAEALADSTSYYLFVSTVSVYADQGRRNDEESPLAELGDEPDDRLTEDYSNYGALKTLCERTVRSVYGDRCGVVRPGLIVGAHDPTGRFTYWPHRVARGGEVLAPAPPERKVQFVDARDLGDWFVELLEQRIGGVFNATRPGLSFEELLDACREVADSDATF